MFQILYSVYEEVYLEKVPCPTTTTCLAICTVLFAFFVLFFLDPFIVGNLILRAVVASAI